LWRQEKGAWESLLLQVHNFVLILMDFFTLSFLSVCSEYCSCNERVTPIKRCKKIIYRNLIGPIIEEGLFLKVSLLDADVFGPSLPRMMNLSGEPYLTKDNLMIPLQNHGVKW
jgi:Mrp family chromosome partitioning ATPase